MFDFNQEIHLTAKTCLETGELGIIINGTNVDDNIFVVFSGRGIAHDLVEHVNGVDSIGTVTDEFQALGSLWYTRGETGTITDDGMVNDLLGLVGGYTINGLGPVIPEQPESDYDNTFEWVIESFMEKVGRELDDEDDVNINLDLFCDQALKGFRLGVEKQEKRFSTPWKAYELFQQVQDTLNKHFGITEDYTGARNSFTPEFEGMEYILTITKDDDNGLRVSFEEHYEFDEDEEEEY